MQVLIVGGGGREHALAWKVAQSSLVEQVFVAPGNAGTAVETKTKNIPISATDIQQLLQFAIHHRIDLTIVGSEAPLSAGIVDLFMAHDLLCYGPTQKAAQLESSKAFAKAFMQRHHIPTAAYAIFTELSPALVYLYQQALPVVIKADGLAAGKGVVIAQTIAEAEQALHGMFSATATKVVIEEFIAGEEASFIALCDGKDVLPLATSQDHKTRDVGDVGPNTGGMGAYSPAPVVSAALYQHIVETILYPVVRGMAAEGIVYHGFLYAGLMITPNGTCQVLEFNCRLGDPEAQVLMLRLRSDLVTLCLAGCRQGLADCAIEWSPEPALGVVLAAKGYPFDYPQGDVIHGLDKPLDAGEKIFHAGTKKIGDQVVTQGGRVLCATALGHTVGDAQRKAYALVDGIDWDNKYFRSDIGHRACD